VLFENVEHVIGERDQLPDLLQPVGLSYERKKYLFTHIRQYVPDYAKDILCPNPDVPQTPDVIESDKDGVTGDVGVVNIVVSQEVVNVVHEVHAEQSTPQIDEQANKTSENKTVSKPDNTKKRKSPTCGYCNNVGHRNSLVRGVPTCPKRQKESKKYFP
jgi:5-methylcytosine-specific restriction endonuclease McrA